MSRRRSSITDTNFKGTVTIVDRCDGEDLSCSLLPWIMTEKKGKRGDTNQYFACKELDLGSRKTSFTAKRCANVYCVCETDRDCNCSSTQYGDITLAGFTRAKVVKDEDIDERNIKLLRTVNSAKMNKKRL